MNALGQLDRVDVYASMLNARNKTFSKYFIYSTHIIIKLEWELYCSLNKYNVARRTIKWTISYFASWKRK